MTKIKKLTGSFPGGKLPVVAGGRLPAGLLLAHASADLGGERDGGAFGLEEMLRGQDCPGFAHRDDRGFAGLGPENVGIADDAAFGAVDLRALVFAMMQRTFVLVDAVRVDFHRDSADLNRNQFATFELQLLHLHYLFFDG